MQVAILGLSEIGNVLVEKLLIAGHEVVVWNRTSEPLEQIRIEKAEFVVSQKLIIAHTIEELPNLLRKPRILLNMLPAGEQTETLLTQINVFTEGGDIIIDGSDSNYNDTERRFADYEKIGVKFLGVGLAGGIQALSNGFCMMIGGNAEAYQYLIQFFDSIASPNGVHAYFGTGGSGHYVKMIHNGIEAGMVQAIAEGLTVLRKSDYQLNTADTIDTWQEGGIISSFLLDMATDALAKDPSLSGFDGRINLSDMGKLTVEQAKTTATPVPVIEQAVEFASRSLYDKAAQESTVAKIVQAIQEEYSGTDKKLPETQSY